MGRIPPPRDWRASAWLLIAANLAPAYGILALGWSAGSLLWCYWLENLVIGAFAIARMAAAPAAGSPARTKLFLIPFFVIHYGMFCAGHGLLLGIITGAASTRFEDLLRFASAFELPGIAWMLLALALSHGWSFAVHYLRGGERERSGALAEMARPYGRVVVMHLTVMMGGAALILLDAPLLAALGLLAPKTLVDLRAHFRAHAAPTLP